MHNIYVIADPTDPLDKLIVVAKSSADATALFKELRGKQHGYIFTNTLNNTEIIDKVCKLNQNGATPGYFDYTFTAQSAARDQYEIAADAPFIPYNFRTAKLNRFLSLPENN